MMITGY